MPIIQKAPEQILKIAFILRGAVREVVGVGWFRRVGARELCICFLFLWHIQMFLCVWNCPRPRVVTKRGIFGSRKWFAGVYIGTLFVLLASHAASSKFSLSQ